MVPSGLKKIEFKSTGEGLRDQGVDLSDLVGVLVRSLSWVVDGVERGLDLLLGGT